MFHSRLRFLHIIKNSLHIPVGKRKLTSDLTDAWLSVSSFDLSEAEPKDKYEDESEDKCEDKSEDECEEESINASSNQDESRKGSSKDESIKESFEFDLHLAFLNGTVAFGEDESTSYNKLT